MGDFSQPLDLSLGRYRGFFQVIFLDDLGENLKPAREMGMATILFRDTESGLRELQELSGIQVWKNSPEFREIPMEFVCSHGNEEL